MNKIFSDTQYFQCGSYKTLNKPVNHDTNRLNNLNI